MLFMVVETFRNQDARAVYKRFEEKGPMAREGLHFRHSPVAADLSRCWQVMECAYVTLLQSWVTQWSDLVAFEIIPVVEGRDTAAALKEQQP
jgi:hypothetical protein